jgi:hypothetical protein
VRDRSQNPPILPVASSPNRSTVSSNPDRHAGQVALLYYISLTVLDSALLRDLEDAGPPVGLPPLAHGKAIQVDKGHIGTLEQRADGVLLHGVALHDKHAQAE